MIPRRKFRAGRRIRGCRQRAAQAGLLAVSFLLLASPVHAARSKSVSGYLAGQKLDLRQSIPSPPRLDSLDEAHDRAIFRDGRPPVASVRWTMAVADADETIPAMLHDFSSAVGIELSPDRQPALARLLGRMRLDTAATADILKAAYRRPRPFLLDPGPVCQDRTMLARSYDYPSGHTVWGTAVALVLAELRPDRATWILARGQDYGESRIICGAHSLSAVRAGRQAAAGLVAVLHGSARFREDLEQARRELRVSRKE